MGRTPRVAVVALVLVVLGVAVVVLRPDGGEEGQEATGTTLGDAELTLVAQTARGAFAGEAASGSAPDGLLRRAGAVFAAIRGSGRRLASEWRAAPSAIEGVAEAVAGAKRQMSAAEVAEADTVELSIAHSYRPLLLEADGTGVPAPVHRGVRGLELRWRDKLARYAPTHMLATNRDYTEALTLFRTAHDIPHDELADVKARSFAAEQLLIPIYSSKPALQMFRGNTLVATRDVTEQGVERAAELMTEWLFRGVSPDGRMVYSYWPSAGQESSANNMIRQWMATVALMRGIEGDQRRLEIARRNLRYNLAHFYREENGLGVIDYDGEVKLGAVALAALAIIESPDRSMFSAEEAALLRTVDRLWSDSGRFDTFLRPESRRDDNQNFYPGEALLLWATLYRESHDPTLLARFMTSFGWYREWHLDEDNRNPAFVPWHTQAHFIVWQETRDEELASFIFEMNDWLLDLQQWHDLRYPDLAGRFYDPDRPDFGPPHASSTGVYLEGLIDAFALAEEVGDKRRAAQYRQTIVRGIRSVMQLQFVDEVDAYYVSQRHRVTGGVRTEVYDNRIRVDNVQHSLMGFRKILQRFEPADYRS